MKTSVVDGIILVVVEMEKSGERSQVDVSSEEDMIQLGSDVGKLLKQGDVLGLVGDLGAGKTHFVKGIAKGIAKDLESGASVTSPTFTLLHEYADGRVPLFHFDFYRIDAEEELLEIGWDEYVEVRDGVVVVEWADKFPNLMPSHTAWWRFEILEGDRRRIQKEEAK